MLRLSRTPPKPTQHIRVNPPPVKHAEDPDLGPYNLIHHPIIPDAELPIALQSTPQWFSIPLGGRTEAGFYGPGNTALEIEGDRRQVLFHHLWMVDERIRHLAPLLLKVGPGLFVCEGRGPVERGFACLSELGEEPILLER